MNVKLIDGESNVLLYIIMNLYSQLKYIGKINLKA